MRTSTRRFAVMAASASILAVGVLMSGCQKPSPVEPQKTDAAQLHQTVPGPASVNQSTEDQTAVNRTTGFPKRPVIGPGKSNWVRPSKKGMHTLSGPTTTDLNTLTPADLVAALLGSGPNAPAISNVTFTGANVAAGTFTGGMSSIGFDNGVVLSSGNVASVAGPNTADNTTTDNGQPGDGALDAQIPGYTTHDAAILEFDFECPSLQVISFQYVFASEEYNEYVNSEYNDVFGFFVNGNNIALIPSTVTPVSINNVNCGNPYDAPLGGSHCDLFRNNDLQDGGPFFDTQMDGLTVILTATAAVNPGPNHIRLAIADAGDYILDSDVFIKGNSFTCTPPEIHIGLDIHPTSCPNPVNVNGNGLTPVAILGNADFDVHQIDLSTVKLNGVSPTSWYQFNDVGTNYTGDLTGCTSCLTTGADGYADLSLKFNTRALGASLLPATQFECRVIEITGSLLPAYGGTPFRGSDIVKIITGP